MSAPLVTKSLSRLPKDENISWFHGKISREEAEEILISNGKEEGMFLVRESSSAPGDFVLSVVSLGNPVHYQIRKNGDDAYYSIDNGPIIHGLEMLVQYYQNGGEGLSTILTTMCKGLAPPPEARRHGLTKLLHRATDQGDVVIVQELLQTNCQYIDAKNQEGQTAVHVASLSAAKLPILKVLLEFGANANVRDGTGRSPLHYACQENLVEAVELLLDQGRANFQLRASDNGWVPMHEAASRGYSKIVEKLVSYKAPCWPRASDTNETPYDLALKNKKLECATVLASYQGAPLGTSPVNWFHGNINRTQASTILEEAKVDGSFLVRTSSTKKDVYVLSLNYMFHVYNYEILKKGHFVFIDDGPYLESITHLIQHYSLFPDGLPINLSSCVVPPCPPSSEVVIRLTRNLYEDTNESGPTTLLTLPHLIPLECLKLGETLGKGEFGEVVKAVWNEAEVAVKMLQDETIRHSFVKEVNLMTNLEHPCVVKLLGVCLGPPLMMVQELIPLGSMIDYLCDHSEDVRTDPDIYLWAAQIAWGMRYLHQKRFIHRDLAARNILLVSKSLVKISDFGLSRELGDADIYRATTGGRWPVKWYAPESINYGTFSQSSDVWSYGVTLWEMFSPGQQPYGDMMGAEVLKFVESKKRLPQPVNCPSHMYTLMTICWNYHPKLRPTFSDLLQRFLNANEYISIHPTLVPLVRSGSPRVLPT